MLAKFIRCNINLQSNPKRWGYYHHLRWKVKGQRVENGLSWGTEKTSKQHHIPQEELWEESEGLPGTERCAEGAVWSPDSSLFQMLPFPFKFGR